MLHGVVVTFDDVRGDGWLRTEDGREAYFHCVTIADGSRTIAVGSAVRAERMVGHLGVDEATQVQVLL